MREAATVSARLARFVLAIASSKGVEPGELLAAVGLDADALADVDGRIPLVAELALWDEAAKRTGDPDFGLHAAEAYRPGPFDVFDYVCRSAPDVRGAILQLVRYNRLLHDIAELSLAEEADEAKVVHRFFGDPGGPNRQAAEVTLATIVVALRLLTGRQDLAARRVAFFHPAPGDVSEHRRIFGTDRIEFGARKAELVLDRAHLDLPLLQAEAGLHEILRRHAEALLSALPPLRSFGGKVRELLASKLSEGVPTLEDAAASLRMSPRSLQRRLTSEGTSFEGALQEVRRGLAFRYLEDPSMSLGEVAFLLGYSEPSAFHRAFTRWAGTTPGKWRSLQRGS